METKDILKASNRLIKSDFNNFESLKQSRTKKKITKKSLKIKENQDDIQSVIEQIQEYYKLKQNFTDMGIEDIDILKRNFPIIILNPGFEDSVCPSDRISLGNIV